MPKNAVNHITVQRNTPNANGMARWTTIANGKKIRDCDTHILFEDSDGKSRELIPKKSKMLRILDKGFVVS